MTNDLKAYIKKLESRVAELEKKVAALEERVPEQQTEISLTIGEKEISKIIKATSEYRKKQARFVLEV